MHALTTATTNGQQQRFAKFELQKKEPEKKVNEEGLRSSFGLRQVRLPRLKTKPSALERCLFLIHVDWY